MDCLKKLKKGFTLIELLVVVSIIGILATLVTANLNSARERARDVQRKSDLKQFQAALESFANANSGIYPSYSGTGLIQDLSDLCSDVGVSSIAANCPKDPKNEDPYVYRYISNGTGSGSTTATLYNFSARLESSKVVTTPYFIVCSNGKSGEAASYPAGSACPL